MISDTKTIIFLGNGRCYHTLDWFSSLFFYLLVVLIVTDAYRVSFCDKHNHRLA